MWQRPELRQIVHGYWSKNKSVIVLKKYGGKMSKEKSLRTFLDFKFISRLALKCLNVTAKLLLGPRKQSWVIAVLSLVFVTPEQQGCSSSIKERSGLQTLEFRYGLQDPRSHHFSWHNFILNLVLFFFQPLSFHADSRVMLQKKCLGRDEVRC